MSQNVFEKIAQQNNTTADAVKKEILFAISCARLNSPEIWDTINGTLEEQILYLAHLSLARA